MKSRLQNSTARIRVLISAYACEQGKGSEPEVGWRVTTGMAEYAEVTVVTRANNRANIEEGLSKLPKPHPRFIYQDLPRPILKLKKYIGSNAYYLLWQLMVRWRFRNLLEDYDLIHHVTFNGCQVPGFWCFQRRPVLLGPLGGGMLFPAEFYCELEEGRFRERVRGLMMSLLRWNPIWRLLIRSADRVLAANRETAFFLDQVREETPEVMLETAFDPAGLDQTERDYSRQGPNCHVIWVGSLIPRKAPKLAIRMIESARQHGASVTLEIIGDGSLKKSMVDFVDELGLGAFVKFRGKLSRAEVDQALQKADVFLFSSLRDTSGNVILEAMCAGLPVIVPDHHGASIICSPDSAILLDVSSPAQFVADGADALLILSRSAEQRRDFGQKGYERLKAEFSWSKYHAKMAQIYQEVVFGEDVAV